MTTKADPLLLLRRQILAETHTGGSLYVRGTHFCYTLEDQIRETIAGPGRWNWHASMKVPKQTAIPSGTYEVAVTWSNRFQRRMPLIMGVPDFDGIRFHGGSTVENTEGCPLLGRKRSDIGDRLWDSFGLTDQLAAIIDDESMRGKVYVRIENP